METLIKNKCPECKSSNFKNHSKYKTSYKEERIIFECVDCGTRFSETKNTIMEGLKTQASLIWTVIKARTEGLSLNSTSRTFGIAKNTIIAWEKRFYKLSKSLRLYSYMHSFLSLIIEGDEVYTKIKENTKAHESNGWTILLIDRASRFIWELECGKKDKKLFKRAIKILVDLVTQTEDLTLFTDGERRYGLTLFELCNELVHTGKKGRPKKTLKKNLKVRVKNKGSQSHKKGPKRPKYQAPIEEHPQTIQNINNSDIHANHTEAFFSSLRRRCSAFRRKSNTYSKNITGLQRILNVYWVIHNFGRAHFTTKEIPAVTIGIVNSNFKGESLFQVKIA